jgi:hypothetical protein
MLCHALTCCAGHNPGRPRWRDTEQVLQPLPCTKAQCLLSTAQGTPHGIDCWAYLPGERGCRQLPQAPDNWVQLIALSVASRWESAPRTYKENSTRSDLLCSCCATLPAWLAHHLPSGCQHSHMLIELEPCREPHVQTRYPSTCLGRWAWYHSVLPTASASPERLGAPIAASAC